MQCKLSIEHSRLSGEIPLVSSKSISNRMLIINALSEKKSLIRHLSTSHDTQIMQQALNGSCNIVNIEDAGTCMRFLTAYFACGNKTKILQCNPRMKQRPIGILVDALRSLGAEITYLEKTGYPPLHIRGKNLKGEFVELKGDTSSQFITALLLIAPVLSNGLKIKLKGKVVSFPYIEMTLKIMRDFGIESQFDDNIIHIKPQQYQPIEYFVEADWSAASYWYSMIALANEGSITLKNLTQKSTQGDAEQVPLFKKLGVYTHFLNNHVILKKKKKKIKKIIYDFNRIPDLAQTFAVCCSFLDIPFVFSGLETLHIKETDRIKALINELGKFGYQLTSPQIGMLIWDGEKSVSQKKIVIDTYHDHRMAMAFTPAVFKIKKIYIDNPDVIKKSYPEFWEHLILAGIDSCFIDSSKKEN